MAMEKAVCPECGTDETNGLDRWVPEMRGPNPGAPALREPNETCTVPTGRGVCSDNLRAFPWADPAGSVR